MNPSFEKLTRRWRWGPAVFAATLALAGLPFGDAWAGDASIGKAKSQACAMCHGALGIGTMPDSPNLAAQPAIYLTQQLRAFRGGERKHEVMNLMAKPLSDDDIENLAAWYASIRIEAHAP